MGRISRAAVVTIAVLASGCAARVVMPPPVFEPGFPDFVYPEVPANLRSLDPSGEQEVAWQWLQSGAPRTAEREFETLLVRAPSFYPAEAGLGFVELATEEYERALGRFERVLGRSMQYAPALAGRGEALLALGRVREALGSFEAALDVDGSLEAPRRRVEVLQFRVLQANLSDARRAVEAGEFDVAVAAYQQAIAASPESAFLYRELGIAERRNGDPGAALERLQQAVEIDPGDAATWREIGDVLEEGQDLNAALAAYTAAARLDRDPDLEDRISRLRASLALVRLPPEYQRVPDSAVLTRGELAALIGVRFETLLASLDTQFLEVVTDTRGHWAAPWIFEVTRLGIIEAYRNHTFQPRGEVRRGDLARSVGQLLGFIAERNPRLATQWRSRQAPITDVPRGNLNYPAVSLAVASGTMPLLDDGTFQLTRPVSGAEAVAVIDRLVDLMP